MSTLPQALMQAGHLSQQQVNMLHDQSLRERISCIDLLLQENIITASALAQFCVETFDYPLAEMHVLQNAHITDKTISLTLFHSLYIAPLSRDGSRLTVAISDPTNTQALNQIQFQTQLSIDPVIVEHPQLLQLIARQKGQQEPPAVTMSVDDDATPVVHFLQKILNDAIDMGASDLHFEPFEKFYRIRFRIDGVLREIAQPSLSMKDQLASRIKVISGLDIAEKRLPQDGRMKLATAAKRAIDCRVSTLPTQFGEKIVLRLLDNQLAQTGLAELGYEQQQQDLLLAAIHRPYGMVLMTGPTGSGKTVSLYTCLNHLNQININIATAEDPVEIYLPGINQVNMNDRAGLNFAVTLRALLRQDPDVIMVGEIRDTETADIAVKAAQTGHLVLSTLHTNDAPSTLTRLFNMGVAPCNIASSVIMITAQRLARRLCHCKQPCTLRAEILLAAGCTPVDLDRPWNAYKSVGCARCNGTGYKGRVGIYQVMPISAAMENIILARGNTPDIATQAAQEGVLSLRQAGLEKVRHGLTSIEEVLGCTNL